MTYSKEKTKYQIKEASDGFRRIYKRYPTTLELNHYFETGQHKLIHFNKTIFKDNRDEMVRKYTQLI